MLNFWRSPTRILPHTCLQKLLRGVEENVGSGVSGGGVVWDTHYHLKKISLNNTQECCRRVFTTYSQTWEKSRPLLARNILSHGLCGRVTRKMEQWNLNVFQPPVGNS